MIKNNGARSWPVQCLIHTLGQATNKNTSVFVFLFISVTKKNNGPIPSLLESIRRLPHAQAFLEHLTHRYYYCCSAMSGLLYKVKATAKRSKNAGKRRVILVKGLRADRNWIAVQNQAVSPSTLLLREACYRAVGEGFAHVSQHIDFTTWYASELQGLLEKGLSVCDLCCCYVTCHEVTL